eukprot:gnl/MRDRNA2_/MRDRNA2_97442_c0_seq1.p1 gnl/MRDRNA2_/MRDRNA2_97442_c0~~gnl/MRDRNA2_/MRDRNA2_97442_c0_seq1.p1  ORF type:complete len:797 (-),score=222.01 gnl/MRDRNA2_/MRDRNA2_97442_c0_seq1:54-2444(-)
METEERKEIMSLPQLQNLMKRDPEAYKTEFDQQWEHFVTMMEMFQLKPQRPHKNFGEQVMFLAHVSPCFPDTKDRLPEILIKSLQEHHAVLHVTIRRTLVSALILLRNRFQFELIKVMPLYFKLFTVDDRTLRQIMFTHIVRDIAAMNLKSKNQKAHRAIQSFLFKSIRDNDENVSRRAAAVLIALNRQGVWTDGPFTNLLSQGLLSPDVKIAAALAHLFLGNKTQGLEGILASDDEEEREAAEAKEAAEVANCIVGAKKTNSRVKRLKRAKKHAQRLMTKSKKKGSTGTVNFAAIDLLNDSHGLAERLLQRISKGSEPFLFRLLLLHLVGRLVGRHQLLLLNFYPYIIKYLQPNQRDVTKFLACLAEGTHPEVPPEELKNVIDHILRHFVTEAVAPEVMEVGINTLRECATRAPHCIGEEQLTDICGYKKFKHKGVMMAVRSLINTFREINPSLLHRSLRGKEASMAISRGEANVPVFGKSNVRDNIDGLELLAKKKSFKPGKEEDEGSTDAESESGTVSASEGDDEDGLDEDAEGAESDEEQLEASDEEIDNEGEEEELDDDSEEEECDNEEDEPEEGDADAKAQADKADVSKKPEPEPKKRLRNRRLIERQQAAEKREATKARAKSLATECVLGPKDFKKLRRARLQQSVELQIGRKRKLDEMSFSDSDSDGSSNDSGGSEQGTGAGDLPGGITAGELAATPKRGKTKAHRMGIIEKGRTDWWADKQQERKENRKGGTTNKEKRRNKPQMMMNNSMNSRKKKRTDMRTKTHNLKKHIKNLGKKVGGKIKRRRV